MSATPTHPKSTDSTAIIRCTVWLGRSVILQLLSFLEVLAQRLICLYSAKREATQFDTDNSMPSGPREPVACSIYQCPSVQDSYTQVREPLLKALGDKNALSAQSFDWLVGSQALRNIDATDSRLVDSWRTLHQSRLGRSPIQRSAGIAGGSPSASGTDVVWHPASAFFAATTE